MWLPRTEASRPTGSATGRGQVLSIGQAPLMTAVAIAANRLPGMALNALLVFTCLVILWTLCSGYYCHVHFMVTNLRHGEVRKLGESHGA